MTNQKCIAAAAGGEISFSGAVTTDELRPALAALGVDLVPVSGNREG